MKGKVWLLLVLVIALCGCSETQNRSPASYVSDVVTYGEGLEAFVCYFVLKDSSGRETANNGTVTLKVEDKDGVIYSLTWPATKEHFRMATVGQGAFERKRLIYSAGRITYSEFTRDPIGFSGTVSIEFRIEDQTLRGEDTLFFD